MTSYQQQSRPKTFSVFFFLWTNLLTLVVIFTVFKLFTPNIWQAELTAPWWQLVLVLVTGHFIFAFVEFFFHRYVLHSRTFWFFNHFYTEHNRHHSLTNVTETEATYSNKYPITEPHQLESSFFPWYAYGLFALAFTPLIVFVNSITAWPILIGTYLALLLTVILYEMFHIVFHKPLSWWQPRFTSTYGAVWKRIYAFHLDHHLSPSCNESVSGFFGIPIADLVFCTYYYSGNLYPNRAVKGEKQARPKPILMIYWLDRLLSPNR